MGKFERPLWLLTVDFTHSFPPVPFLPYNFHPHNPRTINTRPNYHPNIHTKTLDTPPYN